MANIFISGGGDENTSKLLDQSYIDSLQWWKRILYIPWAFHSKKYSTCQDRIDNIFPRQDWYSVTIISEEDIVISSNIVNQYDGLYIWWWNTYRLLYLIKKTWFDQIIKKFIELNKPIYWGSAWAIIFWKEINTASDMNIMKLAHDQLQWLNLFKNYSIFCHYKGKEDQEIQEYVKYYKIPVIALPEWVGIYRYNNVYKVEGNGFASVFMIWWKIMINAKEIIDL